MTRTHHLLAALLVLVTLAVCPAPARAQSDDEGVDHLQLAAVLVATGHMDRAERVLEQVDLDADGLDLRRFHTLRGVVASQLGHREVAVESLRRAIELGNDDPALELLLAQLHFDGDDCPNALRHIERAGPQGRQTPGAFELRVHCHWRLGHAEDAWKALETGAAAFPDALAFDRLAVRFLIERGLVGEATQRAERLMTHRDATDDDALAVAEGLRRAGRSREAALVLERARLRFGPTTELTAQLARTWADAQHPRAAAALYQEAAWQEPRYAAEAAETFRRAGLYDQALRMNGRVEDPTAQARQRLGILLEMEQHEAIIALEPRLSRLGLLEDEQVRYALAWALFQTGRYAEAERRLRHFTDPELYRQSTELLRVIAGCTREPRGC